LISVPDENEIRSDSSEPGSDTLEQFFSSLLRSIDVNPVDARLIRAICTVEAQDVIAGQQRLRTSSQDGG
jgi:hypothetical protein